MWDCSQSWNAAVDASGLPRKVRSGSYLLCKRTAELHGALHSVRSLLTVYGLILEGRSIEVTLYYVFAKDHLRRKK